MSLDYRIFINRDLPHLERACTSKAAFVSRGEANQVARRGQRSNGQLAPYHCEFCSRWHLGHHRRR